MLRKNQLYLDRGEQIPTDTESSIPEEKNVVTLVSRQTKGDIHAAESRRADIYQQALSIMPVSSENTRRADYIAAGIIVTVLGSWLGGAVLKSRVITVLIYVLLVVLAAVVAGSVLGALLGLGFIPVDPLQVLLFAIAGIAILVLGVGLSLLMQWSNREDAQQLVNETPIQHVLVPVREANPLVVIPVKELNPLPHVGRRNMD